MAAECEEGKNGCTFLWKIENISHCWLDGGEKIISPAFTVDSIGRTKWTLAFYPKFANGGDKILLYLLREKDCSGPDFVDVKCQLTILSKDDPSLNIVPESIIRFNKNSRTYSNTVSRNTVFVDKREEFIYEDTLTIQCMIWKKSEKFIKPKHLSARTVFRVNRRSFDWKIEKFSTLKSGVRIKLQDDLIDFDLILNEGLDFEKNLVLDGKFLDETIKYFSFKTCIIDFQMKKEDCGIYEYFAEDLKKGVLSTVIFTKKLMESKSRYLPNDVLSLECEYVYSDGTILYHLCGYGIVPPKVTIVPSEKRNPCVVGEKLQVTPALVMDMKSMFNDGLFSDMELRTSSQNFPVHKNILSARSPVFKRMFSNDMKEVNIGRVDITDLDGDTVQRMLLYIYTDSLENMQYESASKLYAAADKYEISSLRNRCSSFLKDSLCPTKACDILILADLHHDDNLKNALQDYILKYDKEIFGSKEWKHIMDTESKLAADTMYRKYFPG